MLQAVWKIEVEDFPAFVACGPAFKYWGGRIHARRDKLCIYTNININSHSNHYTKTDVNTILNIKVVDNKGNDFFKQWSKEAAVSCARSSQLQNMACFQL